MSIMSLLWEGVPYQVGSRICRSWCLVHGGKGTSFFLRDGNRKITHSLRSPMRQLLNSSVQIPKTGCSKEYDWPDVENDHRVSTPIASSTAPNGPPDPALLPAPPHSQSLALSRSAAASPPARLLNTQFYRNYIRYIFFRQDTSRT